MIGILKNTIRCNYCGDVIESTYQHDYVKCSVGVSQLMEDGIIYADPSPTVQMTTPNYLLSMRKSMNQNRSLRLLFALFPKLK